VSLTVLTNFYAFSIDVCLLAALLCVDLHFDDYLINEYDDDYERKTLYKISKPLRSKYADASLV